MYRQPHPLYAPRELAPVLLDLDGLDLAAPTAPLAECVGTIQHLTASTSVDDDPRDAVFAALAGHGAGRS